MKVVRAVVHRALNNSAAVAASEEVGDEVIVQSYAVKNRRAELFTIPQSV